LDIFGDESSQQKRFAVYGTVSCEAHETRAIEQELTSALLPHASEVKWNKLSDVEAYKRFTSALFECFKSTTLRYRCIVVERLHEDQDNSVSPELRLIKYIHTLLMSFARDHAHRACHFHVRLDGGSTDASLDSLCQYLNRQDRKEHRRDYDAFKVIEPAESKDSRLVQAADLLSGAIAYVTNGEHFKCGRAENRQRFAEFIAQKAQLPPSTRLKAKGVTAFGTLESLGEETFKALALKGVGIWHVDPRAQAERTMRQLSRDQLALLPKGLTFGELKRWGFQIDVVCPRCDRYRKDFARDNSDFCLRRLHSGPRLRCQRKSGCPTLGVILLRPDPFAVPLVVSQMQSLK